MNHNLVIIIYIFPSVAGEEGRKLSKEEEQRSNQTFPRNLRPRKFVNASTIHGIERERETESSRILFRFTSQLSKGLAIMSSELKQLIVVVEGTAALGPYWQTIVSDYLLKIIRFLSLSSLLILGFMRS